jgi:predicted RNA-binding protein associated with RNAse of E/G family
MELIRILKRTAQSRIEFIRDLVALLQSEEFTSNEVFFKDAVDELYYALREEVVGKGRKDLADAYEKAVVLRTLVLEGEVQPERLLEGILEGLR